MKKHKKNTVNTTVVENVTENVTETKTEIETVTFKKLDKFNTQNENIRLYNMKLLTFVKVLEILTVNFVSHVIDSQVFIKKILTFFSEYIKLYKVSDENLYSELVKCNNISLTSTEIEELKKTRQVYLTKKFSNSIKFENNKFKINIFELMKLESFKTTLSYILRNFVNYNSKFLFNDYIETSREKDTDKVKNSVKLHELLFSSEQNVYSYNLLRNLTFLNELRETFVSNETNENLKNELKKSSVLLLNKDILSLKYDVNKSKERKLFKKDYSQIKIVNNDEVEKLKELNVFEQINVQMNEMFNIENMSECFNIK